MQPTTRFFVAAFLGVAMLLAIDSPANQADAAKGKDLFARRCSGCHGTDTNKEGPLLRGVYGRKAAGVPGFPYSDSIKKLNLNWDEKSLDRWLTDPDAMAPDTDMAFRSPQPDERKQLIAYLKSLSTK